MKIYQIPILNAKEDITILVLIPILNANYLSNMNI